MPLILGLNAYHGDSSASIVRDGKVIAAAEEERFRRIKHWAGFPSEAIRYCLKEAGAALEDIDHLAINSNPKAHLWEKVSFALLNCTSPKLILDRLANQRSRLSVEAMLADEFPRQRFVGKIHCVEHHMAHLASAFLVSPYSRAAALSIDGFGDFASAAWGLGEDNSISIGGYIYFPHSLGAFYQAVTQYLGFSQYGDEYKVMGLAPYGKPIFLEEMRKIVRLRQNGIFSLELKYFRHHAEKIDYAWSGGSPHVGTLFSPALEDLLGPARTSGQSLTDRHRDIAHSAQAIYEEAFFHLLDALHERYKTDALTLAGGCAMNSVANGKVFRRSKFKRVYIQAAAGDAGGAIGAALHVYATLAKGAPPPGPSALTGDNGLSRAVMDHAYLGPQAGDAAVEALLNARRDELEAGGCSFFRVDDEAELFCKTAEAIARGDVVGWFHGRMEWGPRALGNRSIVCDPRRADMKDILNLKIKRRESFRPFAPSIQREYVAEWFEEDADVPFMMQVFQIKEDRRATIPAVTHVDGSGRLQTVHRETNPRYWNLIDAFRKLTGVPILLNTSFNENEPVVCRPEEALDCFMRTKMDLLVISNFFVVRKAVANPLSW